MFAQRSRSNRVEWEANWFSSGLLMPEPLFRKKFEEFDKDVSNISKYFGVSNAAANIRIKDLNLNSNAQFRFAKFYIKTPDFFECRPNRIDIIQIQKLTKLILAFDIFPFLSRIPKKIIRQLHDRKLIYFRPNSF